MLSRIAPPLPEAPSTISRAAPPRPFRPRLGKLFRRGLAIGLLAAGGYAMLADAGHIASENAVMTARLVSLRAPVDGMVQSIFGAVGTTVTGGVVLAEIENPRMDERPREAARQSLARAEAELAAARHESTTLQALLDDLGTRTEQYREAIVARLTRQATGVRRQFAGRLAELAQARREMQRKTALSGTVADADIERAQAAVDVGEQEAEALAWQIAAAETIAASAARGVLAEAAGGNDVAYSTQRADEVRLRQADLDRDIAVLTAAAEESAGRLARETRTLEQRRAAVVSAPAHGMIWRMEASAGEQVAVGDLVAQLVDCGAAFLAVAVPQLRLSDIEIGSTATFRLSGERAERSGRVVTVTGESVLNAGVGLAAIPQKNAKPTGIVLVAVAPSPNVAGECLVGRTAHVLLPTAGSNWFDVVLSQVPGADVLAGLARLLPGAARAGAHPAPF